MDITMSRVSSASDTCDIYFTYTKVDHLLYTCSLDPFEDGILLDTSLVCMHRYCRSFTDVEKECKCQGPTTPSAREAWKRRRKKGEEDGAAAGTRPDIRTTVRIIRAQPDHPGNPTSMTPEACRIHPAKLDHPDEDPDHPDPHPDHPALPACMPPGRGPCTCFAPSLTPSPTRL